MDWEKTIQLFASENPGREKERADFIRSSGERVAELVPKFIKLLKSRNFRERTAACRALGEICPQAEPAIPELLKLLVDGQPAVRMEAGIALSKIDLLAAIVVIPVLKLLQQDKEALNLVCIDPVRIEEVLTKFRKYISHPAVKALC